MSGRDWNRRQVIAATGVAAAAPAVLGVTGTKSAPRWDILGVGAGTSGMMLAIFAARRGARVLLLDSADRSGGSLHVSTGQMSAAGTRLQRARGIEDSAQAHYDDLQRITRGTIDPVLARKAVWNAAGTFDWLMEQGLEVLPHHPVDGEAHEPYSKPRYYWGPEAGRSILKVLREQLEPHLQSGQVQLQLQHEAIDLNQDRSGAVTGVVARDAARRARSFQARHVVLASGGYCANAALYQRLSGRPLYVQMAYAHATGRGLELARDAGAALRGAENFMANYGLVLASDDFPAPLFARPIHHPHQRQPWEIHVNVRGERFVREDIPSVDAREQSLLRQPGMVRWMVYDDAIFAAAPPLLQGFTRDVILRQFGEHPWFHRADDLRTLARSAGIDADGLARSVEMYNYGVRTGHDPFGRLHKPLPILRPPYFAIKAQATSITGAVGVTVDDALRVLRTDGSPIPNLYASGEILGAGQTQGKAYSGGMMVTPALTFGRLLGGSELPL